MRQEDKYSCIPAAFKETSLSATKQMRPAQGSSRMKLNWKHWWISQALYKPLILYFTGCTYHQKKNHRCEVKVTLKIMLEIPSKWLTTGDHVAEDQIFNPHKSS